MYEVSQILIIIDLTSLYVNISNTSPIYLIKPLCAFAIL